MYAEPVPVTTQELVEQTVALKALRTWADLFAEWYNAQQEARNDDNDA